LTTVEKLSKFRELMKENRIDYYLVTSEDYHGSEFVSEYFRAREYLSGFTGSAGVLVIGLDEAGLWTDGRYYIQAEDELRGSGITLFKYGMHGVISYKEYILDKMTSGMTLGFDGRCVFAKDILSLKKSFDKLNKNIQFRYDKDLVDDIWQDRPQLPGTKAFILGNEYAGESAEYKLEKIRKNMEEKNSDIFVLSTLDDICWTLNVRGRDVEYCPLLLSYLIIYKDKAVLYCNRESIFGLKEYFDKLRVTVKDYNDFYNDLKSIDDKNIILNPAAINYKTYVSLTDNSINCRITNKITEEDNYTTELKAVKNKIELKNMQIAHIKDGVAFVRFLKWFYDVRKKGFDKEDIHELDVSKKLYEERSKMEGFIEESFESISAYGSNASIIHYSPSEKSNKKLEDKGMILLDTGGHYLNGTTDITRTIACGDVTEEEKVSFTLVLKSHLQLGDVCFMDGTTGEELNVISRIPIWKHHMEFRHGTGHGVGYALNVHEGPQYISYNRAKKKDNYIKPGMVISNEPGIYIDRKYGIRTENLVYCTEDTENEFGEFYRFNTLTLVPYDRECIKKEMLTEEEVNLINAYHKRIYEELKGFLDDETAEFLREITKEI